MTEEAPYGVCDICGKPMEKFDLRYGLADPGPRHASCHTAKHGARKDRLAEIKAEVDRIDRGFKDAMSELRGAMRRKD